MRHRIVINSRKYHVSEIKARLGLNNTWCFIGIEPAPRGNEWGVNFVWEKAGKTNRSYWVAGTITVSDRFTHDFLCEP